MTSLIFGTIYLGHKGFTEHRREKQRVKNYERWEGLRDEYDEQRRIGRESRSLDLQRTGAWGGDDNNNSSGYENDRPILTLRDQQEANDARTSWRPQESWDGPRPQMTGQSQPQYQQQQQPSPHRHVSVPAAGPSGHLDFTSQASLQPQRTGAWDEGMPAPLRVSRQSFEDYDHRSILQRGVSGSGGGAAAVRTSSLSGRQPQTEQRRSSGEYERRTTSSNIYTPSALRGSTSNSIPTSRTATPPPQQSVVTEVQDFNLPFHHTQQQYQQQQQKLPVFDIEPVESHVPGGRMAELIERGY